jgi:hypothetical protein
MARSPREQPSKVPHPVGLSPTNLPKRIHPGIILFTVTPGMRKDCRDLVRCAAPALVI